MPRHLSVPFVVLLSAFLLLLGAQAATASSTPAASWATRAGGTGTDTGWSVSALPDGSSIVTGEFSDTATFGTVTLTSAGPSDVFVAKVNADGTWAWATAAGGNGRDCSYDISALPDGSSIITGSFAGTARFGTTSLTSAGFLDVFVAKLDADGTWAWATAAGGASDDYGSGVSVLPDGSSIITGALIGTANFGTTIVLQGGSPAHDIFAARIGADGSWAWAVAAGGANSDFGNSVSVLGDGSSIVTGSFSGSATFGSIVLTGHGNPDDVFTAKVRADGSWAWAVDAGGTGEDDAYGISALADGSSIITGVFQGSATFGTATLTSAGIDDAFAAKLNADGTWAWATSTGGSGLAQGIGVSALPDGSSVITGFFKESVTFGTIGLQSAGDHDVFTARLDADGTWVWATRAGGTGQDYGFAVAALPDGSLIVTGDFTGAATFGNTTLTSAGLRDVFAARSLDAPQAPLAPVAVPGLWSATVSITPLAGGSVGSYDVMFESGQKACTIVAPLTHCTLQGLKAGASYRFRATAANAMGTGSASPWSNAVVPTALPPAVSITGRIHCGSATCTTTGTVPAGITRVTQRATSRPTGRAATGRCVIKASGTKRRYTCTVRVTPGGWVLTTKAHARSTMVANFSKRVQVVPRRQAVTG